MNFTRAGQNGADGRRQRRLIRAAEDLFDQRGYAHQRTAVVDYADSYDHLLSADEQRQGYRMVDRDGDVLLLRSDITLFLVRQIAASAGSDDLPIRACYSDTVLRRQDDHDIEKHEFYQIGAELIGIAGIDGDREVIDLAIATLRTLGCERVALHIGSRSLFDAVVAGLDEALVPAIRTALERRDRSAFHAAVDSLPPAHRHAMEDLLWFIGPAGDLRVLVDRALATQRPHAPADWAAGVRAETDYLMRLVNEFTDTAPPVAVRLDLSEIGRHPYYSGTVFQAYVDGADSAIGSGGRYDRLMQSFGFAAPSVGFSVMVSKIFPLVADPVGTRRGRETTTRTGSRSENAPTDHPGTLTLAIPKGRIEQAIQQHLAQRGIDFDIDDRQLIGEDSSGRIRLLLVKNADLPTYVHHGIAGLGVCGADVIYESGLPFFYLHQFAFGSTKLCIAGRQGDSFTMSRESAVDGTVRIATKFTKFTKDYFHRHGIPVDIVKLNGSVELAAVLGLSSYIVDLVETGSTLRANKLEVFDVLAEIGVHLIANPAYYKFHHRNVDDFVEIIRH